jgi:methylglutaconyl-CoA hydratase
MSEKVLLQVDPEGAAMVTLNRPEVHNAFDPEMVGQLTAMLEKIGADPAVRAVVLSGAGPSFCAGADIAHMKKSATFSSGQNYEAAKHTAHMLHTLHQLPKPTIACVRGAVRGGGIGVVSACDIAIATRTATFRLSEVKLGIIPAMISPYVIAAIGERASRRYMMTGEQFDAAEAHRIGLLHEVVEEEGALAPAVARMLAQLYSSGPNAVAAIKRLIPVSAHAPIGEDIVHATSQRIAEIRATPEAQEGLSAFLEKRPPAWTAPATPKTGGKQ